MTVAIVFGVLCVTAALLVAGARKLEQRAERWDRYSQWLHPPDDGDDGVTLLEDDDHEND